MSETIKLRTPVKVDGVSVDTLTMREPLVSDLLAAKRNKSSAEEIEVVTFANLCEVAPETIKGLTVFDYNRVQAAFRRLTEDDEPEAGSPLA